MSGSNTFAFELPTQQELLRLPRRAVLALVARCVRRVQPAYLVAWPNAPQEHVDAFEQAVAMVEVSALKDVPAHTVRDAISAVSKATTDASAAYFHLLTYGTGQKITDSAHEAAQAAMLAVTAVSDRTNSQVVAAAQRAIASACYVCGGYAELYLDKELLKAASRRFGWTDETPVPPEFFGPLWLRGCPTDFPTDPVPEGSSSQKFVLQITLPEDVSDEDLDSAVSSIIETVSELHVSHGGSGLVVNDKRIYVPANVPTGVDT